MLWRLEHGEWPAGAEGAAVVLLIGTNNLGNGHLPAESAEGAVAVADAILERLGPAGRLVVLEILPRDDGGRVLPWLCPPRCDARGRAFASFAPAVARANRVGRRCARMLERLVLGRVAPAFAQRWAGRVPIVSPRRALRDV